MKNSIAITLLCLLLVGVTACSTGKRQEITTNAKETIEQKTSKKSGDKDWGDVYEQMEVLEAKKKEAQQALSQKSGMKSEPESFEEEVSPAKEPEDTVVSENSTEEIKQLIEDTSNAFRDSSDTGL